MMRVDDLVEAISALQRSDLEDWIREELVMPRQEAGTLLFGDMECARVRLICTLHYELEIDAELCRWCCRWSISFTTPGSAYCH